MAAAFVESVNAPPESREDSDEVKKKTIGARVTRESSAQALIMASACAEAASAALSGRCRDSLLASAGV